MITCMNHRNREADFHCSHCEIGLCKDCVNLKAWGTGRVESCPVCNNTVVNLAPYKPVPPFWTLIPQFLVWPFTNEGWMMFLGWAVVAVLLKGMGSIGGCWGVILLVAYFGLLFLYFYRVISKAEDGKFEVPDWSEFEGFGAMISAIFHFLLATFSSFWPLAAWYLITYIWNRNDPYNWAYDVYSPLGKLVIVVTGLYGIAAIPMAYLVVGVSRNAALVLNPVFVFQQIQKIFKEYLIALLVIVIFLIVYFGVAVLLTLMVATMGGGILAGIISYIIDGDLQLYLFMILGHLLGYMAYQCRFKLIWWKDCQKEPVFLIAGKPASLDKKFTIIPKISAPAKPATAKGASASSVVQSAIGAGAAAAVVAAATESSAPNTAASSSAPAYRVVPPPAESAASGAGEAGVAAKLEEGMHYLEAGRYEEAEACFQAVLSNNPRHLPALRGMAMLALKKKDPEAALEYGRREADQLVKLQRFDTLWERYVELKKGAPNFILNAKDQFVLCRYLFQQGLFMETARTLRELAVAYPDDPISPKALYQCGELLRSKCGKPENAKQIYEYILKKYPDSPLIEQVKKALGEMNPPAGA